MTKTVNELILNWEDFDSGSADIPKFIVSKTYLGDCSRKSYSGDFSCKKATMKMVRRVSYYVIRVYAPTFLSVIVPFVGVIIKSLILLIKFIAEIKILICSFGYLSSDGPQESPFWSHLY